MTDQNAQEPTMEEILASIRRIISEDDAPAETATAAPLPEPEPEPEPAFEPEPEPVFAAEPAPGPAEEDVLDLTERFEEPAAESIGDLDVVEARSEPEPFPTAAPDVSAEAVDPADPAPVAAPEPAFDALVGESAAASAASAFAGLAQSFRKPEAPSSAGSELNFASGSTVEAMVADMLRPMLKDWLDANLPGIVEAQVRREVERIARDAG